MNDNKVTIEFPLLGILTVLFIGLKLTNQIDWSWVWVLSPVWIPFAFFAVGIALMMLFVLIFD